MRLCRFDEENQPVKYVPPTYNI